MQRRAALTAAAAGLLLWGTVAGGDDMFPFGPLHMYSRYYPAEGVVSSTSVRATTADGRDVLVTQSATGIGRGAIEGRMAAYRSDPRLLADLAAAHHRRHPAEPPYVEVRLVQVRWQMEDRQVIDQSTVTIAEWRAP